MVYSVARWNGIAGKEIEREQQRGHYWQADECSEQDKIAVRLRNFGQIFPHLDLSTERPVLRLAQYHSESSLGSHRIFYLNLSLSTMSDERLATFVVGNNYKVLDVIGEGAYGVVWYVLSFHARYALTKAILCSSPVLPSMCLRRGRLP